MIRMRLSSNLPASVPLGMIRRGPHVLLAINPGAYEPLTLDERVIVMNEMFAALDDGPTLSAEDEVVDLATYRPPVLRSA